MSEPTPSPAPAPGTPAPAPAAPPPAAANSTWKYTLGLIAVLVAAAAGYYFYVRSQNRTEPVDELTELKAYITRLAANQKLADGYTDTDPKDLVADAPKDPAKWAKVEGEITFTVVGTEDPAKAAEEWKDFMA